MSLPIKSQIYSEDPQYLTLKLQQYSLEIANLRQQNHLKDEKILLYEKEIESLRSEKIALMQQIMKSEKSMNSYKMASYSKATNTIYDKLTNPQPDSNYQIGKDHSIDGLDLKPKKIYNGLHFKKTKDHNKGEDLLKCIENKPIRKNSNNNGNLLDYNAEKQQNLYDHFMIITASRDAFENAIAESYYKPNASEIRLPPSSIYSYPEMESTNNNIKKTLENYAFPFGVKTERLNLDESFSQLNEIVFKGNNLIDQRKNCFTFVIKTEDSYNKACFQHNQSLYEGIRNFTNNSNNSSKDSADAFVKWNNLDFLEVSNSNSFLYGFGIKTEDFIECKEGKTNIPKKKRYWMVEKAYCFISKYPCTRFFLDAILQILNLMKVSKMKLQSEQNSDCFSKIDTDFVKNFFTNDLNKILEMIMNVHKNITFDSILDIKDSKFPFEVMFQVPDFNRSFYLEVDWVSSYGLSNLKDESFAFILMALLLENPIVFVSENLGLLTSTLMTFLSLISPFKWHYPVVSNLPQDLMQILESPVPILVGINKKRNFVKDLAQKYNHIIFVSLDNDVFIHNPIVMKGIINEDFYKKLRNIFNDFINKLNKKPADLLDFNPDIDYEKNSGLVPNPSNDQRELTYRFFRNIDNFMYMNCIKLIPEKALYAINEKNLLNYEMIRAQIKNKNRDNAFLERFICTQMFTFFLDEFYHKI